MANEVTFGYRTGVVNLTFGVYTKAGVLREVGTAMTETPASSGLYLGTPTAIVSEDLVIIKEGTVVVGQGQYKPQVISDSLSADISTLIAEAAKVNTVFPVEEVDLSQTKRRIYI